MIVLSGVMAPVVPGQTVAELFLPSNSPDLRRLTKQDSGPRPEIQCSTRSLH